MFDVDPKLYLRDASFQSEHCDQYDLLLQIGRKTVSYAVVDKTQDQLKAIYETRINSPIYNFLVDLTNSDPLLKLHYRRVKIGITSFKFTFIPQALFSDSYLPAYSAFIDPDDEKDVILNDIRPARIKNVFAVPHQLQNYLASFFSEPQLFNQATAFLQSIRRTFRDDSETSIFIDVQSGTAEVAVLRDKRLLFYNIYEVYTADDLNYYLLLLIEELQLDVRLSSVTLSGHVDISDSFYSRIKKYFTEVYFADSRQILNQPSLFDRLPAHRYLSLLALNLCD